MNPENLQKQIAGDVTSSNSPIDFGGRLIINGSVRAGGVVRAGGDIIIRGKIENAIVESTGGGIYVDGAITGSEADVRAFGDLKAVTINSAKVSCLGSAYIKDMIFQADLRAKNIVSMVGGDGIIESSYVEAGMEISVKSIGSYREGMVPTRVVLENYRQKELFEISMIFQQKIKQKEVRVAELEKVIDIIKILGSRVTSLSDEKKHDLALKVKEYNEIKVQLAEIKIEKQKILRKREIISDVQRSIVARSEVFSGVEVRIDNAKVDVNRKYENVIFYKRGIVIIGDYDLYMERIRNQY